MTEEEKESNPIQTGTINLIERAELAAKRLEELNRQQEDLLRKNEEILTRNILGGSTSAGTQVKPRTVEDEIKEEAARIMAAVKFKPK